MSEAIAVMQRFEMKYLMDEIQTRFLLNRLRGRMRLDQYGRTSIASLYYDTPDYRLIRSSIDGGAFKEKLRLRSYGLATADSPVFLEMKRKSRGIVYKRRVQSVIPRVEAFLAGGSPEQEGQILRELTRFRDFYGTLLPACLIIYDREAYFEPEGDLRLTVDFNPRFRSEGLNLTDSLDGELLLPAGTTILEIKVQQAMPLWLSAILCEGRIYKSSFSKYGEAYRRLTARQEGPGPSPRTRAGLAPVPITGLRQPMKAS